MSDSHNMFKLKPGWLLPSAVVLLVMVIVFYISQFGSWHLSDDVAKWGQLGDYVGGILNPSIALFALIALLYSLREQHDDVLVAVTETRTIRKREELFRLIEWNLHRLDIEIASWKELNVGILTPTQLNDDTKKKTLTEVQSLLKTQKKLLKKYEDIGGDLETAKNISDAYEFALKNVNSATAQSG